MSFFKSLINTFSGGVNCPSCGTPGAKKSADGVVCLNPFCRYFNQTKSTEQGVSFPSSGSNANQPAQAQGSYSAPASGSTVAIRYRNFQGHERTFTADQNSLRRRHNHLVARVAPSWKEIALSRDSIQNLSEVDLHLPARDRSNSPQPTARERQVLSYHKKYGTSSPLYETIRAKYPDW